MKNKLSFVGMQLPKKYKENFDISSEGPLFGVSRLLTPDEGPSLETSKFSFYYSDSCIPTNESLLLQYWHGLYPGTNSSRL
jgi:hypothetical protein